VKRLALLALALASACDMAVSVDPEGYRCDVGGTCPAGYACVENVCRRSPDGGDPTCAGVTCDNPPPDTCANAGTLRTFTGRCAAGQCSYVPADVACVRGCEAGACRDACEGVSCVSPPVAACADAMTLRTFAPQGTCDASSGQCAYSALDTPCPNGCEGARCKGVDLCASMGVTCSAAPATTCVGASRRTYAATGTCDPGTGQCTYAHVDTPCPNGCAVGQCLTASLTFTQVGPRLRFAINGLDVAPGSSGNSALAVGNGGRLARWDGSGWTELPTGTTVDLARVAFVTGAQAYAVGRARTALHVRPGLGLVTPVALSGAGNTNLVAVSGRGDGEVLLADDSGGWWRLRSGAWTNGTLPGASGPYAMTGAYLDESLRERIVGACGAGGARSRCVAYRNVAGGTPDWTVQVQAGAPGFTAVGGGFETPTTMSVSEVLLGRQPTDVVQHSTAGFTTSIFFTTLNVTPALEGAGLLGFTARVSGATRDVWALTSSGPRMNSSVQRGFLYRLERGTAGLTVTSTKMLETYFGEETLSPNDANGVLVAEVRRAAGVNNVFRRGVVTNEALDIGEDLVGASLDDAGALVAASGFGDLVVRRAGSATYDFRRPPFTLAISAVEARNGGGALLVGEELSGASTRTGVIVRAGLAGYTRVATRPGVVYRDVCRASDSEGWAVGSGGAISLVTASGATAVSSPTASTLRAVDCAPGVAVACGDDGTVLRLSGGAWNAVTPAFPGATRSLSTCRLVDGTLFVGGDGFFYALTPSQGWVQLPAKAGLRRLVAISPTELYGAFVGAGTSEVQRFDGASWGPSLLQVTGELGGGVQVGGRVVWGGTLGALVDGR
jgi:hypothetical protein